MPKIRTMSAGRAGATAYNTNVNANTGGGDKKQGLSSTTNKGVQFVSNAIKNRAYGENRDIIFCVNQLGGIGGKSKMFATTADGVKDCLTGPYGCEQTVREIYLETLNREPDPNGLKSYCLAMAKRGWTKTMVIEDLLQSDEGQEMHKTVYTFTYTVEGDGLALGMLDPEQQKALTDLIVTAYATANNIDPSDVSVELSTGSLLVNVILSLKRDQSLNSSNEIHLTILEHIASSLVTNNITYFDLSIARTEIIRTAPTPLSRSTVTRSENVNLYVPEPIINTQPISFEFGQDHVNISELVNSRKGENLSMELLSAPSGATVLRGLVNGNYNIKFNVRNKYGKNKEFTIPLNITPDTTGPVLGGIMLSNNPVVSVREDEAIGDEVGDINATDVGVGGVTYSLKCGGEDECDKFEIDENTGEISTKTKLDYETDNEYEIIVCAKDSADNENCKTLTIAVQNVKPDISTTGQLFFQDDHNKELYKHNGEYYTNAPVLYKFNSSEDGEIDGYEGSPGVSVDAIDGNNSISFSIGNLGLEQKQYVNPRTLVVDDDSGQPNADSLPFTIPGYWVDQTPLHVTSVEFSPNLTGNTTKYNSSTQDLTITVNFNKSVRNTQLVSDESHQPSIRWVGSLGTLNGAVMERVNDNDSKFKFTVPDDILGGDGEANITIFNVKDFAGNEFVDSEGVNIATLSVDNTSPSVSSIDYISLGNSSKRYKSGASVEIRANFTEPMDTNPQIKIDFDSNELTSIQFIDMNKMEGENGQLWKYDIPADVFSSGNGTGTVTIANGKDFAGNTMIMKTFNDNTFTVDNTPPKATISYQRDDDEVTSLHFKQDDNNKVKIIATFTDDMKESSVPQISIVGNGIANVNGDMTRTSERVYYFEYTVPSGDGTGTISLSNGQDLAGNLFGSITSGGSFIVDNTPPKAAITYSRSGPYKHETDNVTITATFDEDMQPNDNKPKITISNPLGTSEAFYGHDLEMTQANANDNTTWNYSYAPPQYDGIATITLTGKDLAGNDFDIITSGGSFTLDNTPPTATISYLRNGDTVTPPFKQDSSPVRITATFDEDMKESSVPQISIVGTSGSVEDVNGDMTRTSERVYYFDYTVPSGDGTGSISLSNGQDLAGNVVAYDADNHLFSVESTITALISYSKLDANGDWLDNSGPYKENDSVRITAQFSENMKDDPKPTIAIAYTAASDQVAPDNVVATEMSNYPNISNIRYYDYTIPSGDGDAIITITGQNLDGNNFDSITNGDSFTVDNTATIDLQLSFETQSLPGQKSQMTLNDINSGEIIVTTDTIETGGLVTIKFYNTTAPNTLLLTETEPFAEDDGSLKAIFQLSELSQVDFFQVGESYKITADATDSIGNQAPTREKLFTFEYENIEDILKSAIHDSHIDNVKVMKKFYIEHDFSRAYVHFNEDRKKLYGKLTYDTTYATMVAAGSEAAVAATAAVQAQAVTEGLIDAMVVDTDNYFEIIDMIDIDAKGLAFRNLFLIPQGFDNVQNGTGDYTDVTNYKEKKAALLRAQYAPGGTAANIDSLNVKRREFIELNKIDEWNGTAVDQAFGPTTAFAVTDAKIEAFIVAHFDNIKSPYNDGHTHYFLNKKFDDFQLYYEGTPTYGTYENIMPEVEGYSGETTAGSAIVTVVTNATAVTSVIVTTAGSGYQVGDKLHIYGHHMGRVSDLTITLGADDIDTSNNNGLKMEGANLIEAEEPIQPVPRKHNIFQGTYDYDSVSPKLTFNRFTDQYDDNDNGTPTENGTVPQRHAFQFPIGPENPYYTQFYPDDRDPFKTGFIGGALGFATTIKNKLSM